MATKQDFSIKLSADNNFSVLNRIINILNRRRVRIKKLFVFENDDDIYRGSVIMLTYTTSDLIEKCKLQLEKLIEVDEVIVFEGSASYYEMVESVVDVD